MDEREREDCCVEVGNIYLRKMLNERSKRKRERERKKQKKERKRDKETEGGGE